jgi:hypothetical protein
MGTIVDTVGCGVVVDGYHQMDCLAGQHDNDTVAGWSVRMVGPYD